MVFLFRKIGDFARKKSYPSEFTYAIFSFLFLLPALLFASLYYINGANAVCNILFWSMIVYFLPLCLFGLLFSFFSKFKSS